MCLGFNDEAMVPRRQPTLRSRVRTVATVGLAIYGAYKLGEWIVGAIRDSRMAKEEEEEEEEGEMMVQGEESNTAVRTLPTAAAASSVMMNRETKRKLQRHRQIMCIQDALALTQRMMPSLREAIGQRTSIAFERHELKRLRGDKRTSTQQQQQALWKDIQNKTLVRFLMTMMAESLLFTVTWLHMHWVTSSPSTTTDTTSCVLLSSSQSTTLYRTLCTTISSFLDNIEERCHAAFLRRTDWDTHSDVALHITYTKFKAGLDDCITTVLGSLDDDVDLWMQYVASLEQSVGEVVSATKEDAFVAELLDLLESPLANEAFSAVFQAMYIDNSVRNLQQVFALKGELPLAQVIAKLSKQSFAAYELDRLVLSIPEVQRISQVFFPEER